MFVKQVVHSTFYVAIIVVLNLLELVKSLIAVVVLMFVATVIKNALPKDKAQYLDNTTNMMQVVVKLSKQQNFHRSRNWL